MRADRRRRVGAALVVAALAFGACSGDDDGSGPAPEREDRPTTTVVDYSGVPLGEVRGTTTTVPPVATGTASIVGAVTGPGGPVPGATVRLERLAGGTTTRTDVLAGPDGRYELRGVAGGRYRIRAFLAPALAGSEPVAQFLADGAEHAIDLAVTDQRGVVARAAVAPSTPLLGEDVNLGVVIASRRVDPDGVVRATPVPSVRVQLTGLGAWSLRTSRPSGGGLGLPRPATSTTTTAPVVASSVGFTDGAGQVDFALRCDQPGDPGLAVVVAVTVTPTTVPGQPPPAPTQQLQTLPLELPACVDSTAPPPTVAGTAPPGTGPRASVSVP